MASHHENGEDDLLVDYFERSATAVRDTFGRFEQDVARPVIDYVLLSFRKRPILSTFVGFYLALSALPVLSFIGFALFVFSILIFLGLAIAVISATCAVGFFGFWLACALVVFLFLSFNLTAGTLATYLFFRLVLRARRDGLRPTLSAVVRGTRTRLAAARGRKVAAKPLTSQGDAKTAKMKAGADDSEGENLVIVGPEGQTSASGFGEKVPGVPIDAPA